MICSDSSNIYPAHAQSMADQNASGTESRDEKYNCIGMVGTEAKKSPGPN